MPFCGFSTAHLCLSVPGSQLANARTSDGRIDIASQDSTGGISATQAAGRHLQKTLPCSNVMPLVGSAEGLMRIAPRYEACTEPGVSEAIYGVRIFDLRGVSTS